MDVRFAAGQVLLLDRILDRRAVRRAVHDVRRRDPARVAGFILPARHDVASGGDVPDGRLQRRTISEEGHREARAAPRLAIGVEHAGLRDFAVLRIGDHPEVRSLALLEDQRVERLRQVDQEPGIISAGRANVRIRRAGLVIGGMRRVEEVLVVVAGELMPREQRGREQPILPQLGLNAPTFEGRGVDAEIVVLDRMLVDAERRLIGVVNQLIGPLGDRLEPLVADPFTEGRERTEKSVGRDLGRRLHDGRNHHELGLCLALAALERVVVDSAQRLERCLSDKQGDIPLSNRFRECR